MSRRNRLLAAVVVVACTATAAVALNQTPTHPPSFLVARAQAPCAGTPPVFLNGTPITASSIRLASSSAVRMFACGRSVLNLKAYGTTVHGISSRLVITENGNRLYDAQVEGTVSLSIPVPEPGWLLIAFPNALHIPAASRYLQISELRIR